MSTNTSTMAMGKAVDADNARTYLETTLGSALDKLDAHSHTGTTGGTPLTALGATTIATGGLTITSGGLTVTAGNTSLAAPLYPPTAVTAVGAQAACALYAGTGVPTNSLGANGDFYFRADSGGANRIYQRASGSWSLVV